MNSSSSPFSSFFEDYYNLWGSYQRNKSKSHGLHDVSSRVLRDTEWIRSFRHSVFHQQPGSTRSSRSKELKLKHAFHCDFLVTQLAMFLLIIPSKTCMQGWCMWHNCSSKWILCHRFGVSSLDSEMWTHSFCLILRLIVAVLQLSTIPHFVVVKICGYPWSLSSLSNITLL